MVKAAAVTALSLRFVSLSTMISAVLAAWLV
jgi:hypothetical protein